MGKTLLSLFSEFSEEELIQLYIYPTIPNLKKCGSYFRITDKEVLKSIFTLNSAGKKIERQEIHSDNKLYQNNKEELIFQNKNKSKYIKLICRSILWKLGHWKSLELSNWLNIEKPDCIFVAPGSSLFFYHVVTYISQKLDVPVVSYICDDFYFSSITPSLIGRFYMRFLRKEIKKRITKSKTVLTICEELTDAYIKEFGCDAKTVSTGTNFCITDSIPKVKQETIAYFGGLSINRDLSLSHIGEALDRINETDNTHYRLEIYASIQAKEQGKVFEHIKSIQMMNIIPGSKVFEAMQSYRLLIHAESFQPQDRLRVRYSISTKIADSLASGVCLLAYGPQDIASIQYLKKNACAAVVTDRKDLEDTIRRLMDSGKLRSNYADKARIVASKNHDSTKQSRMVKRILKGCIEHESIAD